MRGSSSSMTAYLCDDIACLRIFFLFEYHRLYVFITSATEAKQGSALFCQPGFHRWEATQHSTRPYAVLIAETWRLIEGPGRLCIEPRRVGRNRDWVTRGGRGNCYCRYE